MQGRVSGINPMNDFRFVQFRLSDLQPGEPGICLQQSLYPRAVIIMDGAKYLFAHEFFVRDRRPAVFIEFTFRRTWQPTTEALTLRRTPSNDPCK